MSSYSRLNSVETWHTAPKKTPRFIFVSGGVMSAVGKGVTAASISMLLKKHGYKVCPIKAENNLNVDFGTINPIEHGDPFLCFDGLEADVDLGNYERFINEPIGKDNFMTMGQLYLSVINKERALWYNGEDVEPIPHIVHEIIDRFLESAAKSKADFVVVELGGTVGEYENNNGLYYEAARRLSLLFPVAHVHVTYVPVPPHVGEPKTKPAQFGIKELMNMGIHPDFIVIRSELPTDEQRKYKFALKFNIDPKNIISNENLRNSDEVPIHLHKQNFDKRLLRFFNLKSKTIKLDEWEGYLHKLFKPKKQKITVGIVGKYLSTGESRLVDSYYALIKSIEHAGVYTDTDVDIKFIKADNQEKSIQDELTKCDAIVVPIGWGERGVEGKISAIKYARENKMPYLGLCYGMQLACVEYARNVVGLKDANTEEVNPKTKNKIIHSIPFDEKYQVIKGEGSSMRLGTYKCHLDPKSHTYEIYKKHNKIEDKPNIISERHRHRFEFNNAYRKILQDKGLSICGTSPDDFFVEFIELPKSVHPFFIGTQGHPEYKSTPLNPHPLFIEFLNAGIKYQQAKK